MSKIHQEAAFDLIGHPEKEDFKDALPFYALNSLAFENIEMRSYASVPKERCNRYDLAGCQCEPGFYDVDVYFYTPKAHQNYINKVHMTLQHKANNVLDAFVENNHEVLPDKARQKMRTPKRAKNYMTTYIMPKTAQQPEYQTLHAAADAYWQDPEIQEILERVFRYSVAKNIRAAQEKAHPLITKAYKFIPQKWRPYLGTVNGICCSGGGTLLGHLGCVTKFGLLPLLGTSIGHAPALMYGLMAGGSALGIAAWEWMNNKKSIVPTKLQRMATYGMAITGLAGFSLYHSSTGHNHSTHQESKLDTGITICLVEDHSSLDHEVQTSKKNLYRIF